MLPTFIVADIYSPSLELIFLVIAVVANMLLAYVVYRSNPKSDTNIIFALLSIITIFWLANNYLTHQLPSLPQYSDTSLILGRLGLLWAAPMSLLFFLLAHTIPNEKMHLGKAWYYTSVCITVFLMLLNVSPYAFTGVSFNDGALQLLPGPGLIPFAAVSTLFSILAVYLLVRKSFVTGGETRKQLRLVLSGMLIMLALIIGTVLVPIIFFSSVYFLAFTPLYIILFLGMTAYAIAAYHLFDVKVLATEAVTVLMALVLFAKLFGEETPSAQLIDGLLLIFMIVFGFFLVRSVRREVQQRQLIETQEKELEIANQQQESLLHFISHEIKGYLTKNQAAFAAIKDGDFGAVSPQLASMTEAALVDTRKGVDTVIDILDASNLKKGTVAFNMQEFDLAKAVGGVVGDLRPTATEKGISIEFSPPVGGTYTVRADEDKIRRHVLRNVIDNSIKYTPRGTVKARITHGQNMIRITVQDTGVGITPEDMTHLFTEGGHGKDSIKINVHSTGYGLFIAKQITEAHGGKICAESDGEGKGSRFIIELPANSNAA